MLSEQKRELPHQNRTKNERPRALTKMSAWGADFTGPHFTGVLLEVRGVLVRATNWLRQKTGPEKPIPGDFSDSSLVFFISFSLGFCIKFFKLLPDCTILFTGLQKLFFSMLIPVCREYK